MGDSKILSYTSGDVREDYLIGKKLGEGHFGSTYLVTQKATGKLCALKRISKTRLKTLGTKLSDVKREVGLLHHLAGHPNIVSVVAAYEDEKMVCIVMELCSGGELYERIVSKGQYSERDASKLVQMMVNVLDYCHSMNVVHRDLKPENFLFAGPEEDAPLKAIDFGLSIFFQPGEPICAGIAGSPLYLAPEMVASGGKKYSPGVDVWSAGVIMYMLLCGYCPLPTDLPTMKDMFHAIVNEPIDYTSDPWPSISSDAKDLLKGMLERDPDKRLTAKQVLESPWVSQSGVAPDTPLDPSVVDRIRRYATSHQIRKLASRVVAEKLTEEQILGMREIFSQIDVDGNGTISLEEMREGMKKMGAFMPEVEINQIFAAVDVDNSRCIDMKEFFAATLAFNRLIKEENFAAAFEHFDKDGSGFITKEELKQVCEEFKMIHGQADLDTMMAEVDTDQDGRIDYAEFTAMMRRRTEAEQATLAALNAATLTLGKDEVLTRSVTLRALKPDQ